MSHTLGQTGTEETGNLLDQRLGSQESIVLARELLDELLVLVQLLQVIGGHAVDAVVLGTIEIVLVTKNTVEIQLSATRFWNCPSLDGCFPPISSIFRDSLAQRHIDVPDAHVGAGHGGQTDGAGETLVTLGVIVLQTDLKLDGLEEVPLLLIERVVEELRNVIAHSGCHEAIDVSSGFEGADDVNEMEKSYRL